MNFGLNKKSTYFEKQIGNVCKLIVNLYEGGFYLDVPLFKTNGYKPLDYGLVFSIFEKNSLGTYGYGFRPKGYKYYTKNNSTNVISMEDEYGYIYEFVFNGTKYYCNEIKSTVEIEQILENGAYQNYYVLKDKYGNLFKSKFEFKKHGRTNSSVYKAGRTRLQPCVRLFIRCTFSNRTYLSGRTTGNA